MASEYLNKRYPDAKGFSPRSLRRMRDFYRTYENHAALLRRAMKLGWIQNVVIMEADLTMDLREWYMKAAEQLGWSKTELITNIAANVHENNVIDATEKAHFNIEREKIRIESKLERVDGVGNVTYLVVRTKKLWLIWKKRRRR